jgi:hypothetical protein
MKGISSHAHSAEVVQSILGSSSAKVEIADPEAINDPDDERELFIATWCAQLNLIPDEMIMAIPEPKEEHNGGPLLFLRSWEIIHSEVPALRYLVRLRLVEFQDWHTPPPSNDDDFYGGRGSDTDSGDSNYNGYWPGFTDSDGAGVRSRTTRFGGDGDPSLGRGSGPSFQPRQHESIIRVGQFCCPVVSPRGAIPCPLGGNRIPTQGATRVDALVVEEVVSIA